MRIVVNKKYKLIQVMGTLHRYIYHLRQYNIHCNLPVSMKNSMHLLTICSCLMFHALLIFSKFKILKIILLGIPSACRERSGSVVECLTRDRRAAGSSLTDVTALWSLSKTHLSYFSTGSTQEDPSLYN